MGLIVRERNWLEVYPYQSWGGRELPTFNLGQTFMPSELSLKQVRGCSQYCVCLTLMLPCPSPIMTSCSRSHPHLPSPSHSLPLSHTPQGATHPPPRLTERDLLSKMEEYGIGTDATIAEHISKQLERYI